MPDWDWGFPIHCFTVFRESSEVEEEGMGMNGEGGMIMSDCTLDQIAD